MDFYFWCLENSDKVGFIRDLEKKIHKRANHTTLTGHECMSTESEINSKNDADIFATMSNATEDLKNAKEVELPAEEFDWEAEAEKVLGGQESSASEVELMNGSDNVADIFASAAGEDKETGASSETEKKSEDGASAMDEDEPKPKTPEKPTTPVEPNAPKKKRKVTFGKNSILDTKASASSTTSDSEDNSESSDHKSLEAQTSEIKDNSDDSSSSGNSASSSSSEPVSMLSAMRAMDNEGAAEDPKPDLLGTVFGKTAAGRVADSVRAILCNKTNGRSKQTARDACSRFLRSSESPGAMSLCELVVNAVAQTGQPDCDRVLLFDPKEPQSSWGRKVKAALNEFGNGYQKERTRMVKGALEGAGSHTEGTVHLAVVFLSAPLARVEFHEKSNKTVVLVRALPGHEKFFKYALYGLASKRHLPAAENVSDQDALRTRISVLDNYIYQDRGKCKLGHHSLFASQRRMEPAVEAVVNEAAAAEIAAEPIAQRKKARRVEEQAPPVAGNNPADFYLTYDYPTATMHTSRPDAMRYSLVQVLRAQDLSNSIVVTPTDHLLALLRLRNSALQDPATLRCMARVVGDNADESGVTQLTRMLVFANAERTSLACVKKARETVASWTNSDFDAFYSRREEDMGVAHALAGFLRGDVNLDKTESPARVATRRVDFFSEDGVSDSHALALGKNQLLVQHGFFMAPLAKKVYTDLFSRYMKIIGFDPDVGDHDKLNYQFAECRAAYEKKNPFAKACASVGLPGASGDSDMQTRAMYSVLTVVHSLFPPLGF